MCCKNCSKEKSDLLNSYLITLKGGSKMKYFINLTIEVYPCNKTDAAYYEDVFSYRVEVTKKNIFEHLCNAISSITVYITKTFLRRK